MITWAQKIVDNMDDETYEAYLSYRPEMRLEFIQAYSEDNQSK